MNILIPMAGRGERFKNSGFDMPKPILDIHGEPMIKAAVKSLGLEGNYIFIVYDYENINFNHLINEALQACCKNPKIIKINYITQGPASSALLAKEFVNNEESLVITNCDQIMCWDSVRFLKEISGNVGKSSVRDGLVVTYDSDTPKNSYISLNDEGWAVELAEKKVISKYSLNGIHFWKRGSDFVRSAEKMIAKDIRVNNEFYISETYNQLIEEGRHIDIYHIPAEQHWAIGTPEEYTIYLGST